MPRLDSAVIIFVFIAKVINAEFYKINQTMIIIPILGTWRDSIGLDSRWETSGEWPGTAAANPLIAANERRRTLL